MPTKVIGIKEETSAGKYLRWSRIAICVVSFGMVFPNAITEGMERSQLPPYLVDDSGDKKR